MITNYENSSEVFRDLLKYKSKKIKEINERV